MIAPLVSFWWFLLRHVRWEDGRRTAPSSVVKPCRCPWSLLARGSSYGPHRDKLTYKLSLHICYIQSWVLFPVRCRFPTKPSFGAWCFFFRRVRQIQESCAQILQTCDVVLMMLQQTLWILMFTRLHILFECNTRWQGTTWWNMFWAFQRMLISAPLSKGSRSRVYCSSSWLMMSNAY